MKKNQLTGIVSVGVLTLSVFSLATQAAHAEEIVVSSNGSGSNNTVTTTSSSSTTVSQNNEARIENNVTTNADTGNNQASNNTGDNTSVITGDATTTSTVNNENINTNTATVNSGQPSVSGEISGNGSGSQNSVNTVSNTTTSLSQVNNATITNSIVTHANTGNNKAQYNSGNTTIKTGTITALHTIQNKNINNSVGKIDGTSCSGECISQAVSLLIRNNGAYSVNNLSVQFSNDKNSTTYNWADIVNSSIMDLNTGGNVASFNNGDVLIQTGGILAITTINNENINSNTVEISCNCVKQTPVTPPPAGGQDSAPNNNNSSGGGSGSSSGSSSPATLGTAIGGVLPATGSNMLFWLTIASLIMFFGGWYLRFRSGCAPGYTVA